MTVSRETENRLKTYQALLLKWQDKINLISPTTMQNSWERHFEDSLQLLPLIPDRVKVLYDLGSGAGFPGLVLAIAKSDLAVTLIESDTKKCAFLQTVSRETETDIKIDNRRIESVMTDLPAPDIVSARALASLKTLLAYCRPWIERRSDIIFLFPKGATYIQEIDEAQAAGWRFHVEQFQSKTDPAARILLLSSVRFGGA